MTGTELTEGGVGLEFGIDSRSPWVARRMSRTDSPASFNPRARAKWTMGGAIGELFIISCAVPTVVTPPPLI